ncbi:osteoclast stimulatory transmembrane protein-like [Alosa sapidissima]|uniref:osteoclast stimulatory transmembrane protein-like n=1 Tax=Alosa sapidissima TaxID=34773 RepID=UPI001C08BE31|nr:osteoclast stimulatory transmembrane protein-like [Alosa sapidissima]
MAMGDGLAQTSNRLSFQSRVSRLLTFLWDVYSKPTPSNALEVFILFLICLLVSVTMATLLLVWMVFSLTYDLTATAILVGVCMSLMAALLTLVHPVRCTLSILIPSLGTQQGRKILVSTVMTLTIATCVPNMVRNVSWTAFLIRCSSHSLIEGVLNSSRTIDQVLSDMNEWTAKMPGSSGKIHLVLKQEIDVLDIWREISNMTHSMKAELQSLHDSLDGASSVLQKLTGAALVAMVLVSSSMYLIGYLTDLKYDNVYMSRRLVTCLAVSGDATLPIKYQHRLVKTSGVKMMRAEVQRCVWSVAVLGFYAILCFSLIGLDHFIYRTLEILLTWTNDIPGITYHITVYVEISGRAIGFIPFNIDSLDKKYSHRLPLLPAQCVTPLSLPTSSIISSVSILLFIALVLVLGQVFAQRLRRKICASFYSRREDERTRYLLQKILDEREREQEKDDFGKD